MSAELTSFRMEHEAASRFYLGDIDPKNPLASPLDGHLRSLPPIGVHVGDDEFLLDYARRYGRRCRRGRKSI
jgi:acetyl esterase/lipase